MKKKFIEQPTDDEDIDVVIENADMVHIERMTDNGIWIGVYMGKKTWHIRFDSKTTIHHMIERDD